MQEGFLRGADLLSHLHAQLRDADTEAAPILRFLLLATVQPYLGHMRSWLQSTAPVQNGFAAMPAAGLQAEFRAERSRTDDFEEQVMICPRTSSRDCRAASLSCTSRRSHYPVTCIAGGPPWLKVDHLGPLQAAPESKLSLAAVREE